MKSLMPDEEILELLKTVDDPELTNVSVYDLGMVYSVSITGSRVSVTMVPTFAGCPALDFIERDVKNAIENLPWVDGCDVEFSFEHQWTTDLITDQGKVQLKNLAFLRHRKIIGSGRSGQSIVHIAIRATRRWKMCLAQLLAGVFYIASIAEIHLKQ